MLCDFANFGEKEMCSPVGNFSKGLKMNQSHRAMSKI